MKFITLLQNFREINGVTKKDLAEKINVTPTYIGLLEAGSQRAPTLERCKEIARALSLSHAEEQRIIDAAIEERLSQEALEWHMEKMKSFNLKNGKLESAVVCGSEERSAKEKECEF